MRWAEITIEAGPAAVEAVGQALDAAGCAGFEVRDRDQPPAVTGYLPVDDRLEDRLAGLKRHLERLPALGIDGAGTELTLRTLAEEDWANNWKAWFKPIRVGRRLVVTPPWETPVLTANEIPVVIDPGMAFGTGSHPTTQLCLQALEDYVQVGMDVADIGTGSGILAIAAAKLGARTVEASDIDPLAVRIAAENAQKNGVRLQVTEALPTGRYDILVANILADVIISLAEPFARLVKPNGLLIVSGIIDSRETDVRFEIEGAGFSPLEPRREAEWVALTFRRITA